MAGSRLGAVRRFLNKAGVFALSGTLGAAVAIGFGQLLSIAGGTCVLCDAGLTGTVGALAGFIGAGMQYTGR